MSNEELENIEGEEGSKADDVSTTAKVSESTEASETNSESKSADTSKAIENEKVVTFHYKLFEILEDGAQGELLEESSDRQPLRYLHGFGNVVRGLEDALLGKVAGDEVEVTLQPEQAYGLRQENAIHRVPIKHLRSRPGQKKLRPGSLVSVQTDKGVRNVIVIKAGKFNVDVDTNHPLAGRILHYKIKVIEVLDASAEEIAHKHSHGPGGHHH